MPFINTFELYDFNGNLILVETNKWIRKMLDKNPFTEHELRVIQEMINNKSDTKVVAVILNTTENAINQTFVGIRRKYEKSKKITNTYENWRRNQWLRKRLF